MVTKLVECPNCKGSVHFSRSSALTTCQYCGYQVLRGPCIGQPVVLRVDGQAHLAIDAGAPLPASYSLTIRDARRVELLGGDVTSSLELPTDVPAVELTLHVSAAGALEAVLRQEGTGESAEFSCGRVVLAE